MKTVRLHSSRTVLFLAFFATIALAAAPALADLSSNYVCRKFDSWGAADLGPGPGNTLIVSNIGSSGEDGVLIDYDGGEGGGLHWQTIAPTATGLVINLSVGWHPAVGGPTRFGYHQWSWDSGEARVDSDYADLGATGVSYELYLDGTLVHSGAAPNGDLGGAFGELPNGFKCDLSDHITSKAIGDKSAQSQYQWDFDVPYNFGGGNVGQCDLLVVRPLEDLAIAAMGDALLQLANIPSLVIDDAWLEMFGAEVRGADAFSAVPVACGVGDDCDKILRLDNNGAGTQQPVWVWVTYGKKTVSQGFTWDTMPALTGTPLELGATGTVGGNPGSMIARGFVAENAGGAGWDLWAQFGTQPTEIMLRIEGEAALVPWDGTPIVAAGPPTGGTFSDPPTGGNGSINYEWDIDTAMDISGRGTVVTGKIEFMAIDALEPFSDVDRVYLNGDTAALTGGWDITGLPNGLEFDDPAVTVTATGVGQVYDIQPSGVFGVANIGSSGLDGVCIALPAGTQTVATSLLQPADMDNVSFTQVGREAELAKAAGDIITLSVLELKHDGSGTSVAIGHVDHGSQMTQASVSLGGVPVVTTGPIDKSTPILLSAWPDQVIGQAPDQAVVLEFTAPMEVDLGDGVLYVGDRIMFVPEIPNSQVSDMMQMNMQFAALPGTGAMEALITALTVSSGPSAVEGPSVQAAPMRLIGNHPNPFNPMTTIAFELATPGQATMDVFDTRGRRVRELVARHYESGRHAVVWDGRDAGGRAAASGTYLYRLTTRQGSETRGMVLLK